MTHPITPPRELVEQWAYQRKYLSDQVVFSEIAQWGADQELEACCEWLSQRAYAGEALRAARRPKPPSLKEQALETLQRLSKDGYPCNYQEDSDWDTIRRALEQLDD